MPSPRPSLGLPWNVRSARCHCPPVLSAHTPVATRNLQVDSFTATVSIGTAVENVKNILGDSFGRENAREAALAPVARCPRISILACGVCCAWPCGLWLCRRRGMVLACTVGGFGREKSDNLSVFYGSIFSLERSRS